MPKINFHIFFTDRSCKYLISFLESAFTAVFLQENEVEIVSQCLSLFLCSFGGDLKRARAVL